MLRLLIATRNAHKTREFAEILGADFEIADLSGMPDLPIVEETGRTFEENAILKAVAISRVVPGFVVADDSGLEVAALGGAPGVYSARYAGAHATDTENVAKLLADLTAASTAGAVPPDRRARFYCALALVADGRLIATFEGEVTGDIAETPRGIEGFGYDPVFIPTGFDRTFAELGEATKNLMSHRAAAIAHLKQHLSA